jgi:hypothetical protein
MTLIDLYVTEVGKRLPLRGRSDIEAELRSTLEDMLEDRSRKAGRAVDEALMLDLLREYGPPDKVAASYHHYPYVIGPRLYPFFLRVLKIVLGVLTVVLLVTTGIQLATQSLTAPDLAKAIVEGLVGILGAAIQAFGNVVLVFAILERVLPDTEFKVDDEKKTWDPAVLKKAVEPSTIKPWEPIAGIVFAAAALVIFNGYPDLIGIHFLKDGRWISVPGLTQAFFHWLPYINVLWALQIALDVLLLRRGQWTASTRWASIALDAAGIVIGYLLLAGAPIVNLPAEALVATGMIDAQGAAAASMAVQQGARAIIAIVMIVQAVEVVKETVRQILGRR